MQLDLGQKIRELRRRDGRTQEALAEAIGVTSQAVSRWEANGGYPDMEMIPSIANYFGISIDELFGYNNERSKKIDELATKIDQMNFQNNGVDINIDECISLARNALIEFPGNEKIMLCLASVIPVIIFFKILLFFSPVGSTPIFAQKSLGLHRHYLRFSQRRGSHRATHRLMLSKSLKVHILSVYTVIGLFYKNHHKCRRKKSVGVCRSLEFTPSDHPHLIALFTLSFKSIVYSFCIKYG